MDLTLYAKIGKKERGKRAGVWGELGGHESGPAPGLRRHILISYNQTAPAGAKARPAGKSSGAETALPFRKKVLYYGLMLLLTLLVIEGMARLAYYVAYGPGDGGGGAEGPDNLTPLLPLNTIDDFAPWRLLHPFYGYTPNLPFLDLNAMPPRLRQEDTVVIGLLGGSVAEETHPFLQRELTRWFVANALPRQPVVLGLAAQGSRQPQQTLSLANTLLLGGEFDLIVNLDGRNDVVRSVSQSRLEGVFPFFPRLWTKRVGVTGQELRLAGQIGALRREQARRTAAGATTPLRWSALWRLANRYQRERTADQIIRLNHQLAAAEAAYSLEKHGPRIWLDGETAALREAARFWYQGSRILARLADLAGAEYYHFLQPNQYVPGSKPLSPAELEFAYNPEDYTKFLAAKGYPLLLEFGQELPEQGVNYFDLTRIFVAHPETLYRDPCCHLTGRGYELLAAEMVRRMDPALRRRAARPAEERISALAAARRPAEPDTLLGNAKFQVYRQGGDRWLRYSRADCAAADVEPRFFLHLTPRDLAQLPPYRRGHGFDNRDFSFAEAGGFLWQGQCRALLRLPDYSIAHLRTGQYAAGAGELWVAEYAFPE